MIKITFELSEDFIEKNSSAERLSENMESDKNPLEAIKDFACFNTIKKQIEDGKTEFVVTPDKLDEKSMSIYNGYIGQICALAAFSETDKKEEKGL